MSKAVLDVVVGHGVGTKVTRRTGLSVGRRQKTATSVAVGQGTGSSWSLHSFGSASSAPRFAACVAMAWALVNITCPGAEEASAAKGPVGLGYVQWAVEE